MNPLTPDRPKRSHHRPDDCPNRHGTRRPLSPRLRAEHRCGAGDHLARPAQHRPRAPLCRPWTTLTGDRRDRDRPRRSTRPWVPLVRERVRLLLRPDAVQPHQRAAVDVAARTPSTQTTTASGPVWPGRCDPVRRRNLRVLLAGTRGDIARAVFGYNHSPAYVEDVLARARAYGSQSEAALTAPRSEMAQDIDFAGRTGVSSVWRFRCHAQGSTSDRRRGRRCVSASRARWQR